MNAITESNRHDVLDNSDNRRERSINKIVSGVPTSDGDGVKLTRIIGSPQLDMLDPFLLLDCFESDQAEDYIGGFPTHPHRGFETVTYLLNGKMRHKDSAGNEGVIEPGGVQWMTAARGILHSEMPEQEHGLLKGFQLWVNLPSHAKMNKPHYQEFLPNAMAHEESSNGTKVNVIAGTTNQGTTGAVTNIYSEPLYLDVHLPAGEVFTQAITLNHNAFIYVIEGEVSIQSADHLDAIEATKLAVLTDGEQVSIVAGQKNSRFLLIAGNPFNEPVVRHGPFVMNTREQLLQAFDDFNQGKFA
ncbi:pirin family protein [Psychromonas sp. SR45-3]|uniref:pirin family protein n=1 Tax=Psychromonas sp. SR45-3 TaxID=2760930 RepID=UPI0015FB4EEA|nr:pirin family protein [Psychromonas sp. SR45-3]MBB1274783.1 pirin family protein [Psychromonas sp. SR45-3]